MYKFDDKHIIVTGGTRGIGKAIVVAFLHSGAHVTATYFSNDEAAKTFKDELGAVGEKLRLAKFDVSSYEQCETFFEELTQVDVLVNNSGIRKDNIVAAMEVSDWTKVLDTNLTGTFNMSKLAVLKMMKSRYGRIVNISSIGGLLAMAGQGNYAASKAAQIAFSKSLCKEVAKRNITVNNVAPGFIDTELIADLPPEQIKEYKKQVPMKRFGRPQEVANAVMFLASDDASYITGATLEISGGL